MVIEAFSGFSKKPNSTKQPSGGRSITCTFKDNCSVLNPVFLLNGYNLSDNYVKWGSRYYYIDDIVIVANDLAEYHCRTDALATFKADIGASSQYIARCASTSNGRVVDNYYPALAKNTHDAQTTTSPFVSSVSEGCYIVGIQGKGSGGNGGAVTYYRATAAGLKALVNYMLSSPSSYQVSEISEELLQCIFNPLQFIVSCMWFPFTPPVTSGGLTVGWWEATADGINRLAALDWGTNFTISIPKHPKAASRGQYLNLPPFARYKLEAGPWGIIPLDNFNLIDANSLTCDYKVDLITGSGRLNIQFRDKVVHEAIYTAQIGVPIQLGQNMFNQGALVDTGAGVINTIKSAATGDPSGMLAHGLSAIGNAAELTQAIPSSVGSNGTLSFNNIFGITADFLDIADEDNTSHGRPLCEVRTISSLSGFIMCEKADLDTAASPTEKETILTNLNEGFYYE